MNYVVIGNSSAAIGYIEGIRKIDKVNKITVISNESYPAYGRPLISYWLQGQVSDEKMYYRPSDFYTKNNCELLLNETVTFIDRENHKLTLLSGLEVAFDKLLIATGSRPFIPPMEGLEKVKSCFNFMTYDDAKAVKSALKPNSKVLIIGAGLIGLKAAEGIYETSKSITVVDLANRVLPSILDEEGSNRVKDFLTQKGLKFFLNDSVDYFTENTAVLKSGTSLDFDILIVAVGVRPNVELAKEAGLIVHRGISINEKCETSASDIYAAGDCTESIDMTTGEQKIIAILPNAYLQGETAGINSALSVNKDCPTEPKLFNQAIPMNAIGFFGLHLMTAGSYEGEAIITETDSTYKKLVIKDGYLKGFILIGDTLKRAGIYTSLIKQKLPINKVDLELLKEEPQLMLFSKAYRLEKLGGIKNGN